MPREPSYIMMVQMYTTAHERALYFHPELMISVFHLQCTLQGQPRPLPYSPTFSDPYLVAHGCLWRRQTRVGVESMEEVSESLPNDPSI